MRHFHQMFFSITLSYISFGDFPLEAISNISFRLSQDEELRLSMERNLALWFNSTLGLLSLLMNRQETRGSWVKFPKRWYQKLETLDMGSLNKDQLMLLDSLWEDVHMCDLLPLPEMNSDKIREKIDNVFSDILNIPSLAELRELLSREPLISTQSLTQLNC